MIDLGPIGSARLLLDVTDGACVWAVSDECFSSVDAALDALGVESSARVGVCINAGQRLANEACSLSIGWHMAEAGGAMRAVADLREYAAQQAAVLVGVEFVRVSRLTVTVYAVRFKATRGESLYFGHALVGDYGADVLRLYLKDGKKTRKVRMHDPAHDLIEAALPGAVQTWLYPVMQTDA